MMTTHHTIRRMHNAGPEVVVHAEPLQWPPIDTGDTGLRIGHTAGMPGRHWRPQRARSTPWSLLGWAVLIVAVLAVGVMLWPR